MQISHQNNFVFSFYFKWHTLENGFVMVSSVAANSYSDFDSHFTVSQCDSVLFLAESTEAAALAVQLTDLLIAVDLVTFSHFMFAPFNVHQPKPFSQLLSQTTETALCTINVTCLQQQ